MAGLSWEPEVNWLTFNPFVALLGRAGVSGVSGPCRPRCALSLKQEREHDGTRDILRSVCFLGIWIFTQIVELLM